MYKEQLLIKFASEISKKFVSLFYRSGFNLVLLADKSYLIELFRMTRYARYKGNSHRQEHEASDWSDLVQENLLTCFYF